MKSKSKSQAASKLGRKSPFPKQQDESPIRVIACLKKIDDIKRFEETDDCFILGFDPSDSLSLLSNASPSPKPQKEDSDDVAVVGEKGQIALRDFPHSRHLCVKFPFKTTLHDSYCKMCYCYVCDSAAPCEKWNWHCNAENNVFWKNQRKSMRTCT